MQIEKGGSIMYAGEPRQVLNVVGGYVVLAGHVTLTEKQAKMYRYSPPVGGEKERSKKGGVVQGRLW